MALGSVYVAAPTATPARGGLLAVANVVDGDAAQVGAFGAQYLSEVCGIPTRYPDGWCVAPEDRTEKDFDEIDLVEGQPFTIYKGVQCKSLAESLDGWADERLSFGETVAIERAVMAEVLAQSGTTDLTPAGGAVSLINGVAALEGYASTVYGGIPTLHVPRSVVTRGLARDVFDNRLDYTIETGQGSLVANGGGYEDNLGPTGVEAPAGEAWLYITGQVTLVKGPSVRLGVPDWVNNEAIGLAERTWVPLVECFVAAIRVHLEVNDG